MVYYYNSVIHLCAMEVSNEGEANEKLCLRAMIIDCCQEPLVGWRLLRARCTMLLCVCSAPYYAIYASACGTEGKRVIDEGQ